MVPVEVFEELTAERARSLAQAAASVQAEGLTIGSDAAAITERWVRGEISTTLRCGGESKIDKDPAI